MKFIFAIVLCFCLNDVIRTVLSQQEIGDQCVTGSNEKGTCMQQTDCVERENAAHHNEFETCKLNGDGTPIICCVSKSATTKRNFASTRFGGGSGGSNEVTSSNDGDTETKFYTGPKKKTYNKQSHKPTTAAKGGYYETPSTFNSHQKPGGHSVGDYDSYQQPSTYENFGNFHVNAPTFGDTNYYESSNRRPEYSQSSTTTRYTGSNSKGGYNDRVYSPSSNQKNNRPSVAVDGGLADSYNQQGIYNGGNGFSSETRNSNRNSNKAPYDNNRRNGNSNYNSGENRGDEKVNYPSSGSNQNPSTGNFGFGGDDGAYNQNAGNGYENQQQQHQQPQYNRPSSGVYESNKNRPSSGTTSGQNNGYRPSNGNGYNGDSSYENGWTNQKQSSTRRPSNSNDEPIWGTTARTTTAHRGGTSDQRPTGSSQQQKRISEQKCSEYSKMVTSTISAIPLAINGQATTHKVTDCHLQATSLIVGGTKVKIGEFPHMVALGFRSGSAITFNCGGTLISEEYVLTAAHCTHSSLGNPVVVRLGDLNLERDDDGTQPQTINVASVTVHPNYKSPQIYHDIALIKLARKVSFNKNLRPACLQVKREVHAEKVVATGWGSTNYGEVSSDDLLKVALDIIDNNQCSVLYGPDQKFPKGITSSIMCAGELSGKKDTCQGDSGGPLQVQDSNNKCVHYVIGITSSGKSCGAKNSPGIYTRVSEYIPWIESIVWRS